MADLPRAVPALLNGASVEEHTFTPITVVLNRPQTRISDAKLLSSKEKSSRIDSYHPRVVVVPRIIHPSFQSGQFPRDLRFRWRNSRIDGKRGSTGNYFRFVLLGRRSMGWLAFNAGARGASCHRL